MSDVSEWSTAAASNNAASPDGFKEGMAPSEVNDAAREVMAAVRRFYEDSQWINYGESATFLTSTSFRISGANVVSRYVDNRRLRLYGSVMGTIYASVRSATYNAPNTDITIVPDTTELDSTLAIVSASAMMSEDELPAMVHSGMYASASASATDAWNVNLNVSIGQLFEGAMVHAKAPATNKGALTLTPRGLAATAVKRLTDEDLHNGDIRLGQVFSVRYDGADFQLVSPYAKPTIKDWGTFATVSASVDLADAEVHLVAFSSGTATGTLGIASTLDYDKATVIVKNNNRPLVLANVDNNTPSLTQSASTQDFIGFIKSFDKITAVAETLSQTAG